jgi:tryptophan synthase alpha chain
MTGAERITRAFARAHDQGRAALIVYLTAGDPDADTTVDLARAAVAAGADIIELGSPFSDSLADGPVIQAAYARALAGGATTRSTVACARRITEDTGAPVVIMAALNCLLAYGVDRFCDDAATAGTGGLLVPDLPIDHAGELRDRAGHAGLGTVFLVGPDSPPDRIRATAAACTGFVYVVRRRGITGASPGAIDLRDRISQARAGGGAPVAVGFGITTPDDAAPVARLADGVIVGSVLVDAAFRARAGAADPGQATRCAADVVAGAVRRLADATRRDA